MPSGPTFPTRLSSLAPKWPFWLYFFKTGDLPLLCALKCRFYLKTVKNRTQRTHLRAHYSVLRTKSKSIGAKCAEKVSPACAGEAQKKPKQLASVCRRGTNH